ncbi:MAG: phosphate acyltransferase PlsX [Gammaproteobacteria bacterium]
MTVNLALDVMGGDHGPDEIIPAAMHALQQHPELHLLLVGQEQVMQEKLQRFPAADKTRYQLINAGEVVEMDENPASALRNKKDSSMRIAINQVKDGHAHACVSAGNTGALMAISRYVLKMLPGIDRPAICASLPGIKGDVCILDLGANVDSDAEQLLQFAIMGSELSRAVHNLRQPTVGLLNVGAEEIKGNDRVKQAALLLENSYLNYVGFVEGNDLYAGEIDVIVCDGFAGNIALKASEGVAEFIIHHARSTFESTFYGRLAAIVSMPILRTMQEKIDPRRYNGASLLGLRGIVIKSHGSADKVSFAHAIDEAIQEVENNVPDRISDQLEALFH